jgi:hypothetical protein
MLSEDEIKKIKKEIVSLLEEEKNLHQFELSIYGISEIDVHDKKYLNLKNDIEYIEYILILQLILLAFVGYVIMFMR